MKSGWFVAVALVLAGRAAAADPPVEPVTSRAYSIDLYEGFALGSSSLVAMGGAGAAKAIGSSGTLINPSAPAVRNTTDHGTWSWDYHLDYLDGSLSTDYDNAQIGMPKGTSARVVTAGLALRVRNWGGAITATAQTEGVAQVKAEALHVQLAFARWIPQLDLSLGGALNIGEFVLTGGGGTLFQIGGSGLSGGAQWLPRMQDLRLGVAASTPIAGQNVTSDGCDPLDCQGYILPDEVYVPWRVVAGAAYRLAGTRWNQIVKTPFRDERALTAALDLVITGRSPDAYGLQAFGQKELERSGRHTSLSVRGGVEYEWLPGRLRLRAGSYWEPGRFVGVGGRLHATFGVQVRVFAFQAWGPRRGSITLTGDLASRYTNAAVSIGFWH